VIEMYETLASNSTLVVIKFLVSIITRVFRRNVVKLNHFKCLAIHA
jgi:hypothetical protein